MYGLEAIMFDFIVNDNTLASRNGLYCVWIRASEGKNARLVQMWIDPSMATFEAQTQLRQPDAKAAWVKAHVALAHESDS